MDDTELAALLAAHETAASAHAEAEIAAEQARAIDYYHGRMDDLPALDGCSSVVDHSVSVMVDNALAAILKPFVSADEVVRFSPRGPEDVAVAEQATDYVNYVVTCDNPGFRILHDWFKDALLTKLGAVKIWWEDNSRSAVRAVPVDAAGLVAARVRPDYLGEEAIGPGLWLARIEERIADGRVRIENVPPEELLVSPLARSIESAPYVAHKPGHFTRSDLVEMGVDAELADSLPAMGAIAGEDRRSRARGETTTGGALADRSRDPIAVLDEYVRVDFDGDGVSELRRVVRVGDTILLNEPADEAPFALLCPVPMPHRIYGRSIADLAIEGQKVSTAILRQTLDNLYKSNNPRPEVPDTAVNESTWDDLGDSAPGAAIRTRMPGQLQFFTLPFSADKSFAMLEAIAQNVEERTGIRRKGQGFNAEALRKNSADTATQAAIDENSRNERVEMIARIFAETGVKRLFRLVLKLLVAHQPRARLIRLRNQWVPVDPGGWDAEMDVSIAVGLGIGNKAEQVEQAGVALSMLERLLRSPFAWLVEADHVHKACTRLLAAAGIRNADDYLGDPRQAREPAPQPSPEMAKVMGELAIARARAEAEAALARDRARFEAELAAAKATQAGLQLRANRPGGNLYE